MYLSFQIGFASCKCLYLAFSRLSSRDFVVEECSEKVEFERRERDYVLKLSSFVGFKNDLHGTKFIAKIL